MKHLIWVLLLLTGCALSAVLSPKKSFPTESGSVVVDGLHGPVTIYRDAMGVPHVRAENEYDMWFALGFVQAQDRLFQMDLMRRLGTGRTSELVGKDAIAFDAFMRAFKLEETVEAALASTPRELVRAGEAFAGGVNAGAASLSHLPVEYRVLGVDFEPWTITDSMAATLINSWAMSENAPEELVSFVLRKKLDRAGLTDLWKWDPHGPDVDGYWDTLREVEVGQFNANFHGMIRFVWGVEAPQASNNWVVAGSRSESGAPIIANDPHLIQMVPSVWYVAEARGGDFHVAGGILPGTPFPVTGHNDSVAWGLTNTMADYVDLAVLERVGERGYILGGERKDLEVMEFEIPVRGGKPVTQTVYGTEVGPVITELDGTHLVALRWHVLEFQDQTAEMWYKILKSESVQEAMDAAKLPSILSQNLVLGDVHGNIGWQVFGTIPKRRGFSGRVPYPASDPAYGWDGWLTDLPGELNPERGYIATANSKPDHPLSDDISTAFLPSYRKDRISERIEALPKHSPESLGAIQMEWLDAHAQERIPQLLEGTDAASTQCGSLLLDWDFASEADSVGAAVWAVFQEELMREVLVDDIGEDGFQMYLAPAVSGRTVLDANWGAFTSSKRESVQNALAATCLSLKKRFGKDPSDWQWGRLHPLKIDHPFGAESALLKSWNMEEVPYGGSPHTINQAAYSFYGDSREASWIASIRVITPLDDVNKATFIYPGGQSGHPKHPHYRTFFREFLAGERVPLWFSDDDVRQHATDALVLQPRSPKPRQSGERAPVAP